MLEIDEDFEEKEDDKPTIVVLKSGDLTQEEAEKLEKDRKEKEGNYYPCKIVILGLHIIGPHGKGI